MEPATARATEETGEPIVVVVPHRAAPRVVGPGRRERAYLDRIAALEREAELAALVERGSTRRLDKLEGALDEQRRGARELAQREKRMVLALGALQRENELLREKLALAERPRPLLERARPARARQRGFWSRFFSRDARA